MALNANVLNRLSDGSATKVIAELFWDNSYPSGGYVVRPAIFGLSNIYSMNIPDMQDNAFMAEYDPNAKTIRILNATGQNTVLRQEIARAIDPTSKNCEYATAISNNLIDISRVYATGGASPGPREVITSTTNGTTATVPGAGQCRLNLTQGKIEFNAAEDATACAFVITCGNYTSPLFLELPTGTDVDAIANSMQCEVVGV